MSVNIIDLTKNYFTSIVIEKLAGFLDENPSSVKYAINSILPSLLGAAMQNASTTSGATQVMELLNDQTDHGLLDDLPSLLGDKTKVLNLLSSGAKFVPLLLGNKVGSVTNSIASTTELKSSSISSLLSVFAPILMSVLGKQFTSSGMGLSGLTSMLMGQKDSVISALPKGLAGVLNFSDLGDFKGSASHSHVKETEASGGIQKWLPWLPGALIILGIIWGIKNCKQEKNEAMNDTAALVDSTVSTASDLTDTLSAKIETGLEKLGAFFKRKLPNGIELNIPELGIENNLITFIEDNAKPADKTTWFNFDRINFQTGSAILSDCLNR